MDRGQAGCQAVSVGPIDAGDPEVSMPPATPEPDEHEDDDEVKRKFREALERKQQQQADQGAAGEGKGQKIHGTHGPAHTQRTFRRRSGG